MQSDSPALDGPPTTVVAPTELSAHDLAEMILDLRLLDVYVAVGELPLVLLDDDELWGVLSNVARACYARGYNDGLDEDHPDLSVLTLG